MPVVVSLCMPPIGDAVAVASIPGILDSIGAAVGFEVTVVDCAFALAGCAIASVATRTAAEKHRFLTCCLQVSEDNC